MARLTDKVAIITGGAGSIGVTAGKLFASEGAKVLLVDIDADQLKARVDAIGDSASYVVADVTVPEQVDASMQTAVERYGGIDVFLNNAGIEGKVAPITDYPVEEFDKVLAVNVRGVWLGMKYVIPHMQQRGGGSVVITSSVAGLQGTPGVSAYTTSKHAVIGIMRCAALECAAMGIRVNTVHPAPIDNRMMRSLEAGLGVTAAQLSQSIPMGRYGTPAEVAQMMLFLASDESKYCTGGQYTVDGGQTA